MNEEILRIQKMVAEGKVAPEESVELLASIGVRSIEASTAAGESGDGSSAGQEIPPNLQEDSGKLVRCCRRGRPFSFIAGCLLMGLGLLLTVVGIVSAQGFKVYGTGLLLIGFGLYVIEMARFCGRVLRVLSLFRKTTGLSA